MDNRLPHPKPLYILTFAEAWGRFNYYGTQMILVLYFTKVFLLSDSQSLAIYGAFASFSFALPILGGLIADKLIGSYRAIVIGALFFIAANLILTLPNYHLFCIGLGINAFGTGLFKSSCTSLVGSLYQPDDTRKTRGYTIFYMGMNIGATIGPIAYGLIAQYIGWSWCFLLTSIGATISLIFIFVNNKSLIAASTAPAEELLKAKLVPGFSFKHFIYLILICCALFLSLPFLFPSIINPLLLTLIVIFCGIIFYIALKHHAEDRKRIFAIFILSIFGMLFFSASLQVGGSLIIFIDDNIKHSVLGWTIPTIMFTSLYPLAVIVAAPFIAMLWKLLDKFNLNPIAPFKLFYGLLLAAVGFVIFAGSARFAYPQYNHYIPLLLIVIGNLFLGSGELVLTPAIFTSINVLAPTTLKNSMVGLWFLFVALGGYLSGVIGNYATKNVISGPTEKNLSIFQHAFLEISLGVVAISVILLLLIPLINRLSGHIKIK